MRGPIQGWYVTSSRGADWEQAIDQAEDVLPLQTGILNKGTHPSGRAGSRLGSGISSSITNVIIVVDLAKVIAHEIGPISDYLAMLALTQAFAPEQCGTLPSILDLTFPNCGNREMPTSMTAGDLAFLRGLYKANLEDTLSLERSGIHNQMLSQFESH